MAIKIVTGDQGKPHVTANDDGSFHQGVVGTEDYALGVGKKVKATLVSNNSVKIDDGELVMQGVHFRILPGTYENVTINNGNQGQKRKDAIVARYTKDPSSGIENITLAVLQGTPTTGTPVAPTPTTGNIRSGALKHEMILYVVELNGLNVVGVEPAFRVLMTMDEINDEVDKINESIKSEMITKGFISPYQNRCKVDSETIYASQKSVDFKIDITMQYALNVANEQVIAVINDSKYCPKTVKQFPLIEYSYGSLSTIIIYPNGNIAVYIPKGGAIQSNFPTNQKLSLRANYTL